MERMSLKGLTLGVGCAGAVYMLFIGWTAAFFNWGTNLVQVLSSIYVGFEPSFFGGIVGAIWGFIDGCIGGAIIALVYNFFAEK